MLTIARVRLNLEEKKTKSFTYREIYDEWLKKYEDTVKPSTLHKTKRLFKNHILPAFGHFKLEEVKHLTVQKIMNDWSVKFVRARMMMNYAGLVFDYAMRMQLITYNPTKLIKKPQKKESKQRENFYNRKQLKIFIDTAKELPNQRAYIFFRLLAFTGMRKGELLALEWSDIDFKKRTVTINKSVARDSNGLYIGNTKTKAGNRIITLDNTTVDVLKQYMDNLRLAGCLNRLVAVY